MLKPNFEKADGLGISFQINKRALKELQIKYMIAKISKGQ